MSFLNLRKKSITPEKAEAKTSVVKKLSVSPSFSADRARDARSDVLIRPHVTEKAAAGAGRAVYVFAVAKGANKNEVARAVRARYKVTPVKIAMAAITKKSIIVKGRYGITGGGKKAYVYLKKGEKIELV